MRAGPRTGWRRNGRSAGAHAIVVLAVLPEVPAQRGLELQGLRLALLEQLLGVALAFDFRREALPEPLLDLRAVMLREPPPLLRLRLQHEVPDVPRQETKRAVVVLRAALVVAAGPHSRVVVGWEIFSDFAVSVRDCIRTVPQQGRFDRVFERALEYRPGHSGSVPSPRMAM